jgi:hypothetical protein
MCIVGGDGPGHYSLDYRTSHDPLHTIGAQTFRGTRTKVSADVVLTSDRIPPGAESARPSEGIYRVYVACQAPQAVPEQRAGVLLRGELRDTLTGETDPRVPYTHLLHSARVMVKALGCTNKPVVPAQPPASVR